MTDRVTRQCHGAALLVPACVVDSVVDCVLAPPLLFSAAFLVLCFCLLLPPCSACVFGLCSFCWACLFAAVSDLTPSAPSLRRAPGRVVGSVIDRQGEHAHCTLWVAQLARAQSTGMGSACALLFAVWFCGAFLPAVGLTAVASVVSGLPCPVEMLAQQRQTLGSNGTGVCAGVFRRRFHRRGLRTVPYTHLTMPTNRQVYISGAASSFTKKSQKT